MHPLRKALCNIIDAEKFADVETADAQGNARVPGRKGVEEKLDALLELLRIPPADAVKQAMQTDDETEAADIKRAWGIIIRWIRTAQ